MLLTKKYLKKYLNNRHISIPNSLVNELIEQYGNLVVDNEGNKFEYSEQDIYEQVRKIIQNYLEGSVTTENM